MSIKTAGVGHFLIPTAPAAGTSCTSGAANVFTTTYVQLIASTAAALYITGIQVESAAALAATYVVVQLATGAAASEVIIGQYLVPLSTASTVAIGFRPIWPPIPVPISTRIACKTADSVGAKATLITLECLAQSNYVDDGVTVGTVNLVNTLTTYTGNTPQTGDSFARIGAAGASLTGITGVTLAASQPGVTIPTVTTVTNQLTAAAIATAHWQDTTAGDFTAANSIGKSIMNGVALGTGLTVASVSGAVGSVTGNVGGSVASVVGAVGSVTGLTASNLDTTISSRLASVSYTAPSNLTAAQIATGVWQDTTAGDFTTASSIGKSILNGVTLGTGLTVASVSGAVGSVTGAVGSVTGAVASVTGNVGGSVASVVGAVGSVTGNVGGSVASVTGAVGSVTGNVGGNVVGTVASVVGAVGSVTGLTASNLDTTVSSRLAASGYTAPTNLTAAQIATAHWQDTTAGDFTVAGSIGKSVLNGVALGTGLTVNAVTSDVGITQAGADKAWASAARTLTAGTNIVLAKGTGLTGLNDIAATAVVSGGAITTSGGIASADIKKVNAVVVNGNGAGTPWGP